MSARIEDCRPVLRIAETTWLRVTDRAQAVLIEEATALGLRLVVVRPDGETWTPKIDVSDW